MTFLPAGVIDGARTPAETIRRIFWSATKGETGVVRSTDLKVSALGTPGAAVTIGPGAASISSAYATTQSYIVANDAAVTVPVPANTGQSPVTYGIYVAVTDEQYPGQPTPSDPLTATRLEVSALTSPPSNRSYIHLADVTLPANTASVLASHITDRRALPQGRTAFSTQLYSPTGTHALGTGYQQWPSGVTINERCPSWATHAIVRVVVEGMEQTVSGYVRAALKPTLNGVSSTTTQEVMVTRNGPVQRHGFTVAGTIPVDPAWRGTSVNLGLRGKVAVGAAGAFELDADSNVLFDVQFFEKV